KDLLDPGSILPDRGDRLRARHPPLRAARYRDGWLPRVPGPLGPGLHDRDGSDHQRTAPRAGCLRRPGRRGLRGSRRPGELLPIQLGTAVGIPRRGAGLPRCGRWLVDLRLRRHLRHLWRAPVGPGVLLLSARPPSGRLDTLSPAAPPAPCPASAPDAGPAAVHPPLQRVGAARRCRPLTLVVRGHGPLRLMNGTPREMLTARINRVRRAG